jgi:hypothetical protein
MAEPESANLASPGGAAAPKGAAVSIDEILEQGRKRQKKLELGLGIVLVGGGLVFRIAMASLTGDSVRFATYGAIGLGIGLITAGLFGTGRGN